MAGNDSILGAIGRTPVVRLRQIAPEGAADVWVKLEYFNPTGSYKDRMALAMIEDAEARGKLRPGMRVVEYTGGSTGSSLAFVCAVKGYACDIVSSDAFSKEKLATMRAFGARLHLVPSEGGRITPDLVPRMMRRAAELAQGGDACFTDQLHNAAVLDGYAKIGEELLGQLDRPIDAFCGAVGTAGMLMGVSRALRAVHESAKIVALEPASTAVVSGGAAGTHRVEGIGIGFAPPLLDKARYDEARGIDEEEARRTARLLAEKEGIFAGTSSGLNVAAALRLAAELGPGRTVVTVAVDTGLKYVSGGLFGA